MFYTYGLCMFNIALGLLLIPVKTKKKLKKPTCVVFCFRLPPLNGRSNGFLWFPPPINLDCHNITEIVESGIKHHNPRISYGLNSLTSISSNIVFLRVNVHSGSFLYSFTSVSKWMTDKMSVYKILKLF